MRFVLVALAMLVTACTSKGDVSPEAALAVQCQVFASTLKGVTAVKSQLSDQQIALVEDIILINEPLCKQAAAAGQSGVDMDWVAALNVVIRTTQQLSQIKPGGN